ncbi:MAG TPA: DUF4387 domain-containing protein [Phenylobacterium sp.]|nr:DUF4387 domain-containing protein [Phenylobacterium sp.]
MPKLKDVCCYVRSKNAGPFWVTIDLFFDGPETYQRHRDDPAISVDAVALLYGVEARVVRRFQIDALNVIKISIPRSQPQGGVLERDMHSGQQFVPMLDIALA